MEGRAENFTPRGQNSSLGDNFALGSKFAPRGEAKNGPLKPLLLRPLFGTYIQHNKETT
jgi:hypothetical protein